MPAYRNTSVEQIRLRDYIEMGRLNFDGLYPNLILTEGSNQSNEVSDSKKSSSESSSTSPPSSDSNNLKNSGTEAEQLVIPSLTEPPLFTSPNNQLPSLDPNSQTSELTKTVESQSPNDIYSKLLNFYQQYNPAKISNIPSIMRKYAGREDFLLEKLRKKYGVQHSSSPIQSADNLPVSSPSTIVKNDPSTPTNEIE